MRTLAGSHKNEGLLVQELASSAIDQLMLVAPFVKVGALARCLELARPGVRVEVFTRWRLEEIVAGVSDLAVYELLRETPNATLYLNHRLHAKVYRCTQRCLIGSANLTARALGWASLPNLELLVECPVDDPRLIAFESTLRDEAVRVDDDLYSRMTLLVDGYRGEAPASIAAEEPEAWVTTADSQLSGRPMWVPATRQPEDLLLAYSGRSTELSLQGREAARRDLEALSIPDNLGPDAFRQAVAISLLQTPVASMVDRLLSEGPQRFGAVVNELRRSLVLDRETAQATWQTLMRWLLYFVPGRYERRVNRHTEMFSRRA
ncbi:MAG: phospholipase D family protein [Coriobacteriia bacterium]